MTDSTEIIHEHRDDEGSKLGMWLFIFTELMLFGVLFLMYAVYHSMYPEAFHLSGQELDVKLGTINTIILLVSSATIAMSITAIKRNELKLSAALQSVTIILALVFLVNKYFEWMAKFEHGLYPGSELMENLSRGDNLFFFLYFFMTGLHALHIIIGVVFLGVVLMKVIKKSQNSENHQLLENGGLYWHLVDLIWIFLFPLFYLVA
jgi:cytochrome c oxidase subunit III